MSAKSVLMTAAIALVVVIAFEKTKGSVKMPSFANGN